MQLHCFLLHHPWCAQLGALLHWSISFPHNGALYGGDSGKNGQREDEVMPGVRNRHLEMCLLLSPYYYSVARQAGIKWHL